MAPLPRIAIVYDRVNKFGGAERVLQALHTAFPDSTLFTSVFDSANTPWIGKWKVKTSFLQKVPFAKNHHEWFALFMPIAFETLDLSDFDVVLSVTSEAAKGILTKPSQLHICYCLTPTRYLWSHTIEYGKGLLSLLKHGVFSYLREVDFFISRRPDVYIPISHRVAARIKKYYRRSAAEVLYPPVTLYEQSHAQKKRETLLVVSRLVPYKRIDLAIEAALQTRTPLCVIGTGTDLYRLKRISGNSPLITFKGFVSDVELLSYYRQSLALLCPQEEDFGIVSVEAQSQGAPVICYVNSGMAETIVDGKTGLLVDDQTVSAFAKAIESAKKKQFDPVFMRKHAELYSASHFIDSIEDTVYMLWRAHQALGK